MPRVYTKEETDAILARAIELQRGEVTSHEELVAAAGEVGVPPEAIERAAAEVLAKRRDEEEIQALRSRARRGFYAHLVPYVTTSALLGFINYMTGSFPWALIVMLAWGVGLASHLLAVLSKDRETLLRTIERDRERAARRVSSRASVEASLPAPAQVRVDGPRVEEPREREEQEADDGASERRGAR